jgi:hypothetical protein
VQFPKGPVKAGILVCNRAKFHIDFQLISCEPAWSGASSISACSQSFNALAKDGKMAL